MASYQRGRKGGLGDSPEIRKSTFLPIVDLNYYPIREAGSSVIFAPSGSEDTNNELF